MNATVAATAADSNGFLELGLRESLVQGLRDVGYEAPTPIQAATIPVILAGSDVLGQAQTGTGKTGAFALPILSKIDVTKAQTQAMVLVPTRELAIQVAEAFHRYAVHMKGFHVLPIYGGQSYTPQLKGLKRGAHVIVGTPGRVMDHMKRGTLPLDAMSFLVLDEADEMLQMGFIDAIEWILEQAPPKRQIALFSATVPPAIRRIAQRHLRSPQEITIRSKTSTAPNIRQRYWVVSGMHKLDALTRILEVETFDAMLVFVRTKLETVELAERLEARGFEAAPLNGDIPQQQRERTIAALKSGKVDIVVATDVAARGLDVERISHVVNYDVPYDSESYIHRIGRTGRAGRSGEAILFIAPRERNMLRIIERATRQQIAQMNLPSVAAVNEQRVARFKQRIADTLTEGETQAFRVIVEEFQAEHDVSALDVAAALASLLQGETPLLLPERAEGERDVRGWGNRDESRGRTRPGERGDGGPRANDGARDRPRSDGGPRAYDGNRDRPRGDGGPRAHDVNRDRPHGDGSPRAHDGARERPQSNSGPHAQDGTREPTRDDSGQSARGATHERPRGDSDAHRSGESNNVSRDNIHAGDIRGDNQRNGDDNSERQNAVQRSAHDGRSHDEQVDGDDRKGHDASVLEQGDNAQRASDGNRADSGPPRNGQDQLRQDGDNTNAVDVRTDGHHGADAQRDRPNSRARDDRRPMPARADTNGGGNDESPPRARRGRSRDDNDAVAFETFRLEVGHTHGVKPGNIVGAIANEAGLEGRHIGHVDIRDDHSFVDLPEGMPREIFRNLQKVRIVGQELRISRIDSKPVRQH